MKKEWHLSPTSLMGWNLPWISGACLCKPRARASVEDEHHQVPPFPDVSLSAPKRRPKFLGNRSRVEEACCVCPIFISQALIITGVDREWEPLGSDWVRGRSSHEWAASLPLLPEYTAGMWPDVKHKHQVSGPLVRTVRTHFCSL